MRIDFRIECPHCGWGLIWREEHVNQGWLSMQCSHCGCQFFTKAPIPIVDVQMEKELPADVPYMALPEVKGARS